jgi:hypothetical protein
VNVPGLAESKREGLRARIEELDLELPITHGFWLSDQLVHTLFAKGAAALVIDVNP